MPQEFKTALITGASSGIGRALAIWFARRGTTVYAAARRVSTEQAAAKIGRAICSGKRVLTFPWQLAWSSAALGLVPAAIYEPISKKMSGPQVARLVAELEKAAEK